MKVDDGGPRHLRGPTELEKTSARSWGAKLTLAFERRRDGTRLVSSSHEGPLRVQRPFFPEGDTGPCHVYVLHPPGGVVTGDRLDLRAALAEQTHALLTTPGATKLYRTRATSEPAGAPASELSQTFALAEQTVLEWLPCETIAFDGARARLQTQVELAGSATYVGWELLCLGRPAAQERFLRGELRTELRLTRAGELMFLERGRYCGGDALLEQPWGLRGKPVWGTFVVAAPSVQPSWVETVRAVLDEAHDDASGQAAATLVSGVLVIRYLGNSTRAARVLFERALDVLRPLYAGRAAVHPRIWST